MTQLSVLLLELVCDLLSLSKLGLQGLHVLLKVDGFLQNVFFLIAQLL